jgi:hypothetical protein
MRLIEIGVQFKSTLEGGHSLHVLALLMQCQST